MWQLLSMYIINTYNYNVTFLLQYLSCWPVQPGLEKYLLIHISYRSLCNLHRQHPHHLSFPEWKKSNVLRSWLLLPPTNALWPRNAIPSAYMLLASLILLKKHPTELMYLCLWCLSPEMIFSPVTVMEFDKCINFYLLLLLDYSTSLMYLSSRIFNILPYSIVNSANYWPLDFLCVSWTIAN